MDQEKNVVNKPCACTCSNSMQQGIDILLKPATHLAILYVDRSKFDQPDWLTMSVKNRGKGHT